MRRLLVLAFLVLAAPASAGTVTIGSDLSADATFAVSNPTDWVAWGTEAVTQQGQVAAVRIKGTAKAAGGVAMHVQVLRPQGDGKVKAIVTSEDLPLPSGGVNRIDLLSRAAKLCVLPGDLVGMASTGGYDPDKSPRGVPFEVFSRVPGSVADIFKSGAQPGNGDGNVFAGTPLSDVELLMQVDIATGSDAAAFCRPSPEDTPPATVKLRVSKPKGNVVVRRGAFSLRVACAAASCDGTLRVKRGKKVLAGAPVSVTQGTASVTVRFNKLGRQLFKQQGRSLNVTAVAKAGGASADRDIRLVAPGES